MTLECIRELVSTNRKINCRGEQWKLSYINCSDRITTSTRNSISDRTCSIKDMSAEGIRERTGTNRKINSRGEQWQLRNINSSDRITTSTRNSISDRTCSIKDMSAEGIRERTGTNRKINC